MAKYKKVGTAKAAYQAVKGMAEMRKRKVKTKGQKARKAKAKKRVTGTPEVTRRRMAKAGLVRKPNKYK